MQPLDRLLHRIRWDAVFARGTFALGYHDRIARRERVVPFTSVRFDSERCRGSSPPWRAGEGIPQFGVSGGRPGTFSLEDEDGTVRHIPLHRVRRVYKDGAVIWQRTTRAERG